MGKIPELTELVRGGSKLFNTSSTPLIPGLLFNMEDAYKEYADSINKDTTGLTDTEKQQAMLSTVLNLEGD